MLKINVCNWYECVDKWILDVSEQDKFKKIKKIAI